MTINTIGIPPEELTLQRGFRFKSNLVDNTIYNFSLIDSVTVTKSNEQYYFENIKLYQGEILNFSFTYSEQTNTKSMFTLPNENIDTSTMKVEVMESTTNTSSEVYTLSENIFVENGQTPLYFLQEGKNGTFQLYFGDGTIGKKLKDGNVIIVSYLVTSGEIANKINQFFADSFIGTDIGSVVIDVLIPSSGGADRESIDSIKNLAPKQYSIQNRLVTRSDYETFLKSNYTSLDSLSVWGGEENDPPVYGKVFVSMKPKDGYYISDNEKQNIITDLISMRSIVSVTTEIVDPTYTFILFDVSIDSDSTKTTLTKKQLESLIKSKIVSYADLNLNKFNSSIVTSKLQEDIDSVSTSIIGSVVSTKLQKLLTPNLGTNSRYELNFDAKLIRQKVKKTISSSAFVVADSSGVNRTVIIEENPMDYTGISQIDISDPGSNYTSSPIVQIIGDGVGATAVVTVFGGKLQSIRITNPGRDYTNATVVISGGNGFGAKASAIVASKLGFLRTIYFDNNSQRKVVNENVGTINSETGQVILNNLRILDIPSGETTVKIVVEAEPGTIRSNRNNILTFDETDPSSTIVTI
jgi:hypothetical protein